MKSIQWSHFEQRKRKDQESGRYYYERLLLGVVVGIAMVCRAVRIFTDWRNLVYNDDDNNNKKE